mgnify:CR=1 FL=1
MLFRSMRTVSFALGLAAMSWATCSGIARYSMVSFQAHMLQHMALSMLAPLLLAAARQAIDEDGADVLILGSTTMHQSHAYLAERLDVPVINPGLVGFKTCEMLLELALTHSKLTYWPPEQGADGIFATGRGESGGKG